MLNTLFQKVLDFSRNKLHSFKCLVVGREEDVFSEMLRCVFTITFSRKTVCPLCICMGNASVHKELFLGKQHSSSESCSPLTLPQRVLSWKLLAGKSASYALIS